MDIAARLDYLGNALARRAQAQVSAKREIEERWIDDLRQYHGKYSLDTEARLEKDQTGASRIFVNRTRPKCIALAARLSDMLFPSDDRNWAISQTPSPAIPTLPADQAAAIHQIAKQAAEGMQREIEDQLIEARYSDKSRRAMWDLVVLGTCIIKGPVIAPKVQRSWQSIGGAVHELTLAQSHVPDVQIVSPWDFFPDMSAATLADAGFIFERRLVSKKTLRRLAQSERLGYRTDAIRQALREDTAPRRNDDYRRAQLREISGIGQSIEETQAELWEYHGPLDRADIEALGLDIPDDPLLSAEVIVEFIGNCVIRARVHPLDTEDTLYSVATLIPDDSCILGYGLPYVLRAPQIAINSAWRMILDNSAYSIGPQIIIDHTAVKPANGVYALQSRKLWLLNDASKRVNEAMAAFSVSSHQPELMNIYQVASQLIDEESGVPSLMQGELGANPAQTATGMSMLMNSANAVLRDVVKGWDANITKTLLRRFYDYNMQYSDKTEIKGDFDIDARGSSALMVKETQSHALLQFAQLAQSPVFAPLIKIPDLLRKIVETLRLSTDEIIKTDDEIMQEQAAAQQLAQQQQAESQPASDPQDVAMESQGRQMQYQMHVEELASRERMKAAELADKETARQFDIYKTQLQQRQFAEEAALKAATGSGV